MTNQKLSKFSPSKFLHIYSKVSRECSNVYFMHVPVKLESVTNEQDEQLPKLNDFLSKFVPTKDIELSEC